MKAWEANIRNISPYVPGEQPNHSNMIKLNTNENPYPPSPAISQIAKGLNLDNLRLYPDFNSEPLVKELAGFYQVGEENIFVGVGSDDVIAMAFLTFFNSSKPILFPDITYSFYDVWAGLYRIPYERPVLDESFHITKEDYYKENGGVIIANPNAPTSISESLEVIEDILKHNQDVVVIVDEAYVDFGGESAIKLTKTYKNLLVIQTFSKSRSMAGMRIGYAIGDKALIKALNNVKHSYNSYTMSYLSIIYGAETVKDKDYFYSCLKKVITTREYVKQKLSELGFEFPDSRTNFLFITHKNINASDLFLALKKQGIYVRYFEKPRIDNYLRVSIGTMEQMATFLDFVRQYCKSLNF